MVASMTAFAVEDAFLKAAARHVPLGQVMVVMGLCGVAVFSAMSWQRGEAAVPRAVLAPVLLMRSACEVAGRLFYTLALALTPLATASAILQATPLVVIAGAAVLLGERVSAARWAAVGAGFVGVLMILRPGVDGFSALSLLAVAGMLGFAGRDLATRAAPRVLSNRQLGTLGFAMLAVAGALILGWTGGAHWPDLPGASLMAGATVFGIAGYHALTSAMRTGQVSAVTPFRYMRLVCALGLATLVFGEEPDLWTLAGATLIVGAGIFGLTRRR